ncbi:hypothetical protein FE257_012150 [Aspergillus nanangensis]|uniref:HTH La-type RNA-binding domain-containing protein n=1 Tax=Aspergillus nanangensis TaxID=2582783 RepID=A0AAD4CGD9_ASPNN|nr:hypothetical protein FE257_012150 [Aspergillus nanangensis]
MAATFSYAQAAKGIVATQAPTSETDTVSKSDEQNTGSSTETGDAVVSKPEASQEEKNAPVQEEKELELPATKTNGTGASPPSVDDSSAIAVPTDEEAKNTPNGTSEPTGEKQTQTSTTDKQNNGTEKSKEKSGSEKEKAEPPKELKAAPLPSVNIWQQRREAQDAKVKAVSSLKPTPTSTKTTSKTTSAASSISGDNQQEPVKTGNKKSENRRRGDGGKTRDESALPPVADSTMWPTPHVAQGEEKKKTQDKPEKAEKSPVMRSGKEKWMPVPYVPTAVFNTPLPSAARRGGRAARGGRDGARNGAPGAGAADKAQTAQGAQGAAKHAAPAERGRNEPNSARANSLPAPARRSNSADAGLADSRKAQVTDRSRGSKGADNAAAPAGKHGNSGEGSNRHQKTFTRNHDGAHKGGDQSARNAQGPADSQTGARTGSSHDRRFDNGPKSADFAGFNGDRKDKEFPRSERGRGSHRGRGGHSGYSGAQNTHFANNHSHNGFAHTKSFGFNDRHRPQPHGLGNGSRGHGMSMRSPSLPNSASMYNVYPFPTDINPVYAYPQMATGPMSAGPFQQQYMEPFSLMSMITMQLEYYFSVDNLCKDLFLRKHMDSQGFVSLVFIAGFKRIKTLTEDFELLRHVSRQLRYVESVQGEDGLDRLRPRERWEQWVLPMDQRDPAAQHQGPSLANIGKSDETAQSHVDGTTNGVPNGTAESPVSKTPLSSEAPEFSPANAMGGESESATV